MSGCLVHNFRFGFECVQCGISLREYSIGSRPQINKEMTMKFNKEELGRKIRMEINNATTLGGLSEVDACTVACALLEEVTEEFAMRRDELQTAEDE